MAFIVKEDSLILAFHKVITVEDNRSLGVDTVIRIVTKEGIIGLDIGVDTVEVGNLEEDTVTIAWVDITEEEAFHSFTVASCLEHQNLGHRIEVAFIIRDMAIT